MLKTVVSSTTNIKSQGISYYFSLFFVVDVVVAFVVVVVLKYQIVSITLVEI
jgi:hypothetical protein